VFTLGQYWASLAQPALEFYMVRSGQVYYSAEV
jgi:hypothetical protein